MPSLTKQPLYLVNGKVFRSYVIRREEKLRVEIGG